MEIILGKTAGFCFGVQNAVNKTKEQIEKEKNVYCLGELVHNKQVIEELEKSGVIFIKEIEEAKNKLIIRAHGTTKENYEKAKKLNLELIDLTCPKVLLIHKIIEEHVKNGEYIFLIGQKDHPEIVATSSFCGTNYSIIENDQDIKKAVDSFNKSNKNKVYVASQTTYNLEKFEHIINEIENRINKNQIEIKNTICNATRNRQEETINIAKQVDMMIIIGGRQSSNTNKLYDISKKFCKDVILIETEEELKIGQIKDKNKIGIMAGASTPQKCIDNVVEKVKKV